MPVHCQRSNFYENTLRVNILIVEDPE